MSKKKKDEYKKEKYTCACKHVVVVETDGPLPSSVRCSKCGKKIPKLKEE